MIPYDNDRITCIYAGMDDPLWTHLVHTHVCVCIYMYIYIQILNIKLSNKKKDNVMLVNFIMKP